MARKTKPAFVLILAVVSIIGFLNIILSEAGLYEGGDYVKALTLLFIGLGLVIEGGIRRTWRQLNDKRFTDDEIVHGTAITVGILTVVIGFLSLPFFGIQSGIFSGFKIIASMIAIVVILMELKV